jgi:hypothetical protein
VKISAGAWLSADIGDNSQETVSSTPSRCADLISMPIAIHGHFMGEAETDQANSLIRLVGGSGIEPLTPSMSRECSSAEPRARVIPRGGGLTRSADQLIGRATLAFWSRI